MKKLLFIVLGLFIVGLLGAVDVTIDVSIGEGTGTIRHPFNDRYVHSRSQCIYLESEISEIGTIHKLRWYSEVSRNAVDAIQTTQIWLKTISHDVFTEDDWEEPGTFVCQIEDINLSTNIGWYEVKINDFEYMGENLMVSVYNQYAKTTNNGASWRSSTYDTNISRFGVNNSDNPPNTSLLKNRPNIQINMTKYDPNAIPGPASLVLPLMDHWRVNGELLKWKRGPGYPESYDLYLDTINPPLNKVSEGQTELSFTLNNLTAGAKYYWQVVPRNHAGMAANCPIWTFNTPGANNLIESFEGDFPPPGWENPGGWEQSNVKVSEGGYSARRFVATNYTHTLSTPRLRIKNDSILSFWGLRGNIKEPIDIIYSPDRENWSAFCSIDYEQHDIWYYINLNLSSLAGNNYYLGFRVGPQGNNYYIDQVIGPEIFTFDFPTDETVEVPNTFGDNFSITMSGGAANQAIDEVIPDINNSSFSLSGKTVLDLIGTGPWTITIGTSAPWGAYFRDGNWHGVANTDGQIVMPISAVRAGLILPIVLGDSDLSLAVELSAFSASINSRHQAVLSWVSETESDLLGYYLLRNINNDLASAQEISELVPATNISVQQIYVYTDKEHYAAGTYYYWLQACNMNGSVSFYGPIYLVYELPESGSQVVPLITGLQALYPNPFNPDLFINYSLAEADEIELKIYNARGQLLRTLDKGTKNPGEYRLVWDGCDERGQSQSSGVYFIRLQTRKKLFIDKAVLLK